MFSYFLSNFEFNQTLNFNLNFHVWASEFIWVFLEIHFVNKAEFENKPDFWFSVLNFSNFKC